MSRESDIGEYWRDHRDAQKERRRERLPKRTEEILALQALSYTVTRMSEYQYRIDDVVDLYPIHKRYHDLRRNSRGSYRNLHAFITKTLGEH